MNGWTRRRGGRIAWHGMAFDTHLLNSHFVTHLEVIPVVDDELLRTWLMIVI